MSENSGEAQLIDANAKIKLLREALIRVTECDNSQTRQGIAAHALRASVQADSDKTSLKAFNHFTPGSPFMVNMDSVLRHCECFEDGKVSTAFMRKMILAAADSTPQPSPQAPTSTEQAGGLDSSDRERIDWCMRTVRSIADLGHDKPLGEWYSQAVMVVGTLKRVLE